MKEIEARVEGKGSVGKRGNQSMTVTFGQGRALYSFRPIIDIISAVVGYFLHHAGMTTSQGLCTQ